MVIPHREGFKKKKRGGTEQEALWGLPVLLPFFIVTWWLFQKVRKMMYL